MKIRLSSHRNVAFTLIEAMIGIALFFMAVFAILDLVTQSVRMAHSLNQMGPTAGMVAAELSMTNKLSEGSYDGDFGDLYPDYSWQQEIYIYGSNGLFQVDITVFKDQREDSRLSLLMFRPESEQRVGDNAGQKMFSGSGRGPAGRGADAKKTFSGSGNQQNNRSTGGRR